MNNTTRRGGRNAGSQWLSKPVIAGVAAVLLVGGSFALASGSVVDTGSSLLAAVTTAISGRPTVLIGVSGTSPSGTIRMLSNSVIAVYDIASKNATHGAAVKYVSLQTTISQQVARLSFGNVVMRYDYCIPRGSKYGYGYVSRGCGSMTLYPSSVQQVGNDYVISFNSTIPVYPQQTKGTLTLSATPRYTYTGTAVNKNATNATFRVKLTGSGASGDLCRWGYNPILRAYGYVGCVSYPAIINIYAPYSNQLTVQRAYGYGYLPLQSKPPCQS
jgi:hypothetical protein